MMNRDWLATATEQAIEPELEIVDPHHHMWDTETRYGRYELDDLWLDTGAGHNVVDTVFIDCGANYLTEGPEHLRPVGETIYMAGRAAESEESEGATIAANGPVQVDLLTGDLGASYEGRWFALLPSSQWAMS